MGKVCGPKTPTRGVQFVRLPWTTYADRRATHVVHLGELYLRLTPDQLIADVWFAQDDDYVRERVIELRFSRCTPEARQLLAERFLASWGMLR